MDRRKLEKREEDKVEAKNKKHETRQRVSIAANEDKKKKKQKKDKNNMTIKKRS